MFNSCTYYEQRKALVGAQVIVANHDLLLSSLDSRLLPELATTAVDARAARIEGPGTARRRGSARPALAGTKDPAAAADETKARLLEALAQAFAKDNIFVWSGHNYAIEPVSRMGLMDTGGVLRVGLAHQRIGDIVEQTKILGCPLQHPLVELHGLVDATKPNHYVGRITLYRSVLGLLFDPVEQQIDGRITT